MHRVGKIGGQGGVNKSGHCAVKESGLKILKLDEKNTLRWMQSGIGGYGNAGVNNAGSSLQKTLSDYKYSVCTN